MKGFKYNSNAEKVKKIVELTIKNGGYCLCQMPKSEDTLCPCTDFIENKECICGLYEKAEENGYNK